MKPNTTILLCILAALTITITGCGKKADENKPIADVKAEAEKMDAGQLKAMAMKYKSALTAKSSEMEKVAAKLKEIPVTEMLGDKAKTIKTELDGLGKSLSALKDRFQVYYDKLKEKGGDLAGLDV